MSKEVVQEFQQENEVPNGRARRARGQRQLRRAEPTMPGGLAGAVLDVDLSKVALDPDRPSHVAPDRGACTADQRGDQLQRLENSLLRLERINLQTLNMLQQLVQP
jgi:general secretion pathway protein A